MYIQNNLINKMKNKNNVNYIELYYKNKYIQLYITLLFSMTLLVHSFFTQLDITLTT